MLLGSVFLNSFLTIHQATYQINTRRLFFSGPPLYFAYFLISPLIVVIPVVPDNVIQRLIKLHIKQKDYVRIA